MWALVAKNTSVVLHGLQEFTRLDGIVKNITTDLLGMQLTFSHTFYKFILITSGHKDVFPPILFLFSRVRSIPR